MPQPINKTRKYTGHNANAARNGTQPATNRGPLEWKVVAEVKQGHVVAEVSRAEGPRGPMHSFRLGREGYEGKRGGHFRTSDLNDLEDVIKNVRHTYVYGQQAEEADGADNRQ